MAPFDRQRHCRDRASRWRGRPENRTVARGCTGKAGWPGSSLSRARAELPNSRQELGAALLLAEKGYGRQAISQAYFAAFYAAEAALALLGETRSKHAGVIAAFGKLVVREGGLSEEEGRLLRSLFERRNEADYTGSEPPEEESLAAVRDAERFVEALETWIGERSPESEI